MTAAAEELPTPALRLLAAVVADFRRQFGRSPNSDEVVAIGEEILSMIRERAHEDECGEAWLGASPEGPPIEHHCTRSRGHNGDHGHGDLT